MPSKYQINDILSRIHKPVRECRSVQTCWICGNKVSLGEEYFAFGSCEGYHIKCLVNAVYMFETKKTYWIDLKELKMAKKKPEWEVLLDKFEDAIKEYSWLGSKHPSLHESIEMEYEDARQALVEYLKRK